MIQTTTLQSIKANEAIKILSGVFLISISAQVAIPLKPIPIILHTMILMIMGLTYTPKLAMSTMATYLFAGAIGVPVFSNFNGGLPYMMGPTGGYLAGFFAAPVFMSFFRKYYGTSTGANLINCLCGNIILYVLGVTWLSQFIGFEKALYSGFVVFIPTGIAKILVLLGIIHCVKKMR